MLLLAAAACGQAPTAPQAVEAPDAPLPVAVEQRAVGTPATVDPLPRSAPERADTDEDRAPSSELGAPSDDFLALDAAHRSAVVAFFERGPGAVRPGGTIDSVVVGPGTSQGTATGPQMPAGTRASRGDPVPGFPGLYNVVLSNTGSGYVEKFLLQVPDVMPVGQVKVPLLVFFHKFGVGHGDVAYHTNFLSEVRARGWFLIAPLGASQSNFGSLVSQINVRAALQFTRATFPMIDGNRVYGVGFSMGGGAAATYAARHLVPGETRFAAIVNHTGSVSLTHTHASEAGSAATLVLESWFGGPPTTNAFEYQRCSTIDLDVTANTVGPTTDMARNLAHVPIHTWVASNDPQAYLSQQALAFAAHVQPQNPNHDLTVVTASVHDWSTLDETVACDWLAQFTYQEPTSGTLLADQDGVYHDFLVDQAAAGAFTPFTWLADPVQNRITLSATANLQRITVDATALGLAYTGSLRLDLAGGDGTGDQVLLTGVPFGPSAVFRNGQPVTTVVYDAVAHTLLVDEPAPAAAQWVLVF